VLTYLLGFDRVRNYDGSWTEWGNAVRVPIVQGERAGLGVSSPTGQLPPDLAELVEDFAAVGPKDRLQLLLELSRELPELPERYADAADSMEQVHECQSPLFLAVEVEDGGERRGAPVLLRAARGADHARVRLDHGDTGMDGEPAAAVLAVPDDFYTDARARRGREPAAAARHRGDAGADQEAGAGRDRL
jgi:cysteine desulfuration protein SufE